jgi:hypothetical protein
LCIARWAAPVWIAILLAAVVFCGWCARVLYSGLEHPEQSLAVIASRLLPPWLATLIVVALAAAVISAIASQLLQIASALAVDLKRPMATPSLTLLRGMLLVTAVLACIALLYAPAKIGDHAMFAFTSLGASLGPLLLGGFIYAARRVDQGGKAEPGLLLQGVRSGRSARLLAMLLQQVAALLVCVVLLLLLVGGSELTQMAQAMERIQGQAAPDPALMSGFPVGRLMLWLVLVFIVGMVASFFTFVAVPEVMFTESGALEAMKRSCERGMRNSATHPALSTRAAPSHTASHPQSCPDPSS